ncbi:MAG: hypothetical protein QOG15_1807 [Solirubrobacteraceae bacterium]|jgi:predicted transcriptional regulator of viral defense system|nr:hypothetical protein [Solirubrobacteraceae bacterium]
MAELARVQHATVARRQLLALGFGRHAIARMLDKGRLHLVHRGVYAVGQARLTRGGRWMAAVLAVGPGAVLSHRSAAALWHIARDRSLLSEVSRAAAGHDRPGIRVHFVHLADDEVTIVDGIPVTTVARTLLDLAADHPRPAVERAMHEAEVLRLADSTPLQALIDRYPRRRGTRTLRAIIYERAGDIVTRSEFEDRFIAFLDDHALPRALVNHRIEGIGECDFAWPDQRVIVELDGYQTHGTRGRFEADRARDRALQVAGWRVIRITWRQLHDRPLELAADLRVLLSGQGRG